MTIRAGVLVALAAALLASSPAYAGDAAPAADAAQALKWCEQGEVAREEGKWLEAAQAYGKALDADEGNWNAHVRYQQAVTAVGEAAGLVGEYDGLLKDRGDDLNLRLHRLRLDPATTRLEALQALLRANAGHPRILLEVGRAALSAGDAAAAKKALEAAWAKEPGHGELLLLSSEALRRSGDVVGARARLDGATKVSPDLFDAVLHLARLDLLEGKFDDALKRADAVLSMRPSYVAAMLVRSEASSRLGKNEDARSSLETALRVQPDDRDALVALADLTAKGGATESLKKAETLYKKALTAKNVSILRAYYGLGWAQERIPTLPDAAASYRESGLVAPTDAMIVNSVGVVLLKQKRFQEAIVQFKKAIDLDKDGPEAYANMGAVFDEQGDWNEAVKWYLKVLAIKGQDKNVRALLCAAFDYEALSAYKKAEDLLEKVIAVRPDDAEVRTFYGDNLFFQHKWKLAIKAYQEAVRLDDKNRFAWRGLGMALMEDDKPQDAVGALEKARALKGDDATTLISLGDLYASNEIHDLAKAIECYEGYVKAGGADADVPMLVEELKKELENEKKSGK